MRRNKFSLSYYKLLSMNLGTLTPVGITEVLPGDSIQHATSALVRAAPLVAPVMHPLHIRIHHWYVPTRLVWEDFEPFITGGEDGTDASVMPTITFGGGTGAAVGSLADYMGVTPSVDNLEVSAIPFRAYQLIWNDWYRDQDLETPAVIDISSGPDTTTSTGLKRCAWEKDYFTSARPFEQKGPSITIPIGSTAPVDFTGSTSRLNVQYPVAGVHTNVTGDSPLNDILITNIGHGDNSHAAQVASQLATQTLAGVTGVTADLSGASAVTINALREALALQRFQEARARYGSRYVEYLRYLGVRSSDARLQRPEYLGGGKQTLQFSEVVANNFASTAVNPKLGGHGISSLRSNRYRRFFEEHGHIITVMSLRPKTIYAQGLERHWNRRTKEDFFQMELQHIGQQEVLNKEVYAAHATPDGTFGWQDRYDEYRRAESKVAGEFRTSVLDFWHMARIFSADPALNDTFVSCEPTERNFAVNTQDLIYVMARHNIAARRLLTPIGNSYIY